MITKGLSYRGSSSMATVILLLSIMVVTFPSSGWVSAQETTTNTITNTTNTTNITNTTNTTNITTNTTTTTSPPVVAPTSLPAADVTESPTTTIPTTIAPVMTTTPPPREEESSTTSEGCCSWTFNVCIEEDSACASFVGCQACNGYWLPQKPQDPTCRGLFTECNGLSNADSCCDGLVCTLANPNDNWNNCQVPVAETPMPSPSLPTLPPTSAPTLSPTFAGPPTLSTDQLPFSEIWNILRLLSIRNEFDQTVLDGAPRFSEDGLMEALRVMYEYGIGRQPQNDNTDNENENLEYHFYLGEPIPEDAEEDERDALAHEYRYGLANLAMFLSQLVAQPDFFQANICGSTGDDATAMEEDDNGNDDLLNDLNETTALAEEVLSSSSTSSRNPCGALGHTPLCNNNDSQQGRDCDTVYGIDNDVCACVLGQLNAKLGIARLDALVQPRWVYYDDMDFCNVTAAATTITSSSVVCSYDKDVPEGPWLVPMASWILNVQRYVSAETGWNYQDELRALVDSEMNEDLKRILVARVAKLVTEGTHRIPFDPTVSDPSETTFDVVISLYQRILPSIFEEPKSRLRQSGANSNPTAVGWWCFAAVLTTLLAIVVR